MTKLFVFDLDGTLAESKQSIPPSIAEMLTNLTNKHPVAILTGGTLSQIHTQVIQHLPPTTEIGLYACSGTTYQQPHQAPITLALPDMHRSALMGLIETTVKDLGYWCLEPTGQIIEDRLSQITFSALGQQADNKLKKAWDPDGKKRAQIIERLQACLGDYVAHKGGSTSIDITHKSRNKQTGIELIADHYKVAVDRIVYIGDDLQPGGNDYPVTLTAATCYATRNWLHTIQIVKELVDE